MDTEEYAKHYTNGFGGPQKGHIAWNKDLNKETDERVLSYSGNKHGMWKGGGFPYYGYNWRQQRKRVYDRSNYKSELSGEITERLPDVHHIYDVRMFLKKYLELCFTPYIPEIKINSFKYKKHKKMLIPPDTVFIKLIADEINDLNNLIALTNTEHHVFYNMPPSFFYFVLKNPEIF